MPKFSSQSGVRTLNVSGDGVLDVVFGYGTGADGYNVPDLVCDVYFAGQKPCMGGVVALDGRNGKTLWQTWTRQAHLNFICHANYVLLGFFF